MKRHQAKSSAKNQPADIAKQPRQSPIEFGPYLSDRQWATIREDLSADGSCWQYCDFQRSHRDPYLAGEDGLLGVCDKRCRLCFAWAFWNGRDPFVKEKLFGLTGGAHAQGNHGEDVKEAYFYQLNSPSHSYMRAKYMYPVEAFPYGQLIEENAKRSVLDDEFEIYDTGIFGGGYWEVCVEYARADTADAGESVDIDPGDTVCLLTVRNCSSVERTLTVLPTVWFRNTWNTIYSEIPSNKDLPTISVAAPSGGTGSNKDCVECRHPELPPVFVHFCDPNSDSRKQAKTSTATGSSGILFTRNEVGEKDAISRFVTAAEGKDRPRLPGDSGTKCSSWHRLTVGPEDHAQLSVRISGRQHQHQQPQQSTAAASAIVARQRAKAEAFYAEVLDWLPTGHNELGDICRLAYSGLLWSKQYYEYQPAKYLRCRETAGIKNAFRWNPTGWEHLDNADILSMPDKWEFPWYASWDTGFQAAVLVDIDPEFAKSQLELMLSDRYMSPEGQVPGCEFNYSDENPPVLAWSAHEVYQATGDLDFANRVYPRLKRNFAWWLEHRRVQPQCFAEDADAVYFKSGFLGMDNICALDRSQVPDGCRIYQADAYAWVFSAGLHSLRLALVTGQAESEIAYWLDWLARLQRGFRHFDAADSGKDQSPDGGGFCYDIIEQLDADGKWKRSYIRILSMVGLMPLTAVMDFDWHLLVGKAGGLSAIDKSGLRLDRPSAGDRCLVSLLNGAEWKRVFDRLFPSGAEDCGEGFLGPYGVRMVSSWHKEHPVSLLPNLSAEAGSCTLNYEPGESRTGMYGGNSNWRGPVWLCMNYLLAQAAMRMHSGGRPAPRLRRFARQVCQRVLAIFLTPDAAVSGDSAKSARPLHGTTKEFSDSKLWTGSEYALFYEYFHGDTGRGCGASHQTGWTALVVKFAQMLHQKLLAL